LDKPFQFKQFSVNQDRCAMKVGTDGVLLGAWSSIAHDPQSILDIGAGTGLIALQLAQRSFADTIDAIEIDTDAYEQCVSNFENSPWGDRLFCYHASAQEFAVEVDEVYDSIISNPPFFTHPQQTQSESRNQARFEESLPFEHLAAIVKKLLHPKGVFSTVIPFQEKDHFIDLAEGVGLYPARICTVQGTPESPIKRVLLEFTFTNKEPEQTSLVIETERHNYTDSYKKLTKDFYLNL